MEKYHPNMASVFPLYCSKAPQLKRLTGRWKKLVPPYRSDFVNKTVLDIGSHDSRWAYAYAHAGARHVTAIEPRNELVGLFSNYPNGSAKSRISLINQDMFSYLENAVRLGVSFDFVAILGVLYHTLEHARLFELLKELGPNNILLDSEFIENENPMVQIVPERTDKILNAIPKWSGEHTTLVGIPSVGAMEKFAENIEYKLSWQPCNANDPSDYLRLGRKRRKTCYLTKKLSYPLFPDLPPPRMSGV